MEIHHKIPRSRGGSDDEWNLEELSPFYHAYEHALDFVLFPEISSRFDCRMEGWVLLPKDLQDVVRLEMSKRTTEWNTGRPSGNKGTSWFYHPITKNHVMCMECPPGYVPGRIVSEETRQRHSDSQSGKLNGFYRKVHTQESKDKIGRKGWFWVHNNLGERHQLPPGSAIPSGFKLGVGPRKNTK
jgi:hypothetical protein